MGRRRAHTVQRPRAIERFLRRRIGIGAVASLRPELAENRLLDVLVLEPLLADLVDDDHQCDRERHVRRGVCRQILALPALTEIARRLQIKETWNPNLAFLQYLGLR